MSAAALFASGLIANCNAFVRASTSSVISFGVIGLGPAPASSTIAPGAASVAAHIFDNDRQIGIRRTPESLVTEEGYYNCGSSLCEPDGSRPSAAMMYDGADAVVRKEPVMRNITENEDMWWNVYVPQATL